MAFKVGVGNIAQKQFKQPSFCFGGIITEDEYYRYHTFNESGTLEFVNKNGPLDVEYLVIGGGGSGATGGMGGGGAGGYLASTAKISQNQTVTIGAGGPGTTTHPNNPGFQGSASSLGSIATALGGGAGGDNTASVAAAFNNGEDGGSGGGSGRASNSLANQPGIDTGYDTHDPAQGNRGGASPAAENHASGGGGGAGGPGGDGVNVSDSAHLGGTGGAAAVWLDGIARAGGGGGGTYLGLGSTGGGGGATDGKEYDGGGPSDSATPNTGSGSGASANNESSGAGGSGVVIVRYPKGDRSDVPIIVDTAEGSASDGSDVSAAINAEPGDVVFACVTVGAFAADTAWDPLPDYTPLYQKGTHRVSNNAEPVLYIGYKVMGDVPDTTVTADIVGGPQKASGLNVCVVRNANSVSLSVADSGSDSTLDQPPDAWVNNKEDIVMVTHARNWDGSIMRNDVPAGWIDLWGGAVDTQRAGIASGVKQDVGVIGKYTPWTITPGFQCVLSTMVISGEINPNREKSYIEGGEVTVPGDGYRYHTFRESGSLTVVDKDGPITDVEYLVIGGGGGGGANVGGGGGAGSFVARKQSLSGVHTVTIGAGGAGAAEGTSSDGTAGSDSSLGSLHTATGGGGGGGYTNIAGNGGSGGGGGANAAGLSGGAGGTGINSEGFGGSAGNVDTSFRYGGGGGGATELGGSDTTNMDGGDGKAWLDGNTYAGGGGGSSITTTNPNEFGVGGTGGGGDGRSYNDFVTAGNNSVAGGNGTPNTGSGGGAGSRGEGAGGTGGSGLVILRYPDDPSMPAPVNFLANYEDTTDAAAYTFSAAPLGVPADDRFIIVNVFSRDSGAAIVTSSVTINGVTAKLAAEAQNSTSTQTLASTWYAKVPTGETGDIVVTFGEAVLRCAVDVFSAYNIMPGPTQSATYDSDEALPLTLNADGKSSFSIAAANNAINTPTAVTWTGSWDLVLTRQIGSEFAYLSTAISYDSKTRGTLDYGTSNEVAVVTTTWRRAKPYLIGGDVSEPGDGYRYHTFNTSGTLYYVPGAEPLEVDYLVVAGGGGGASGSGASAAGGAGGMLTGTGILISSDQIVTVGAGGSRGTLPTNGSNSSLGSIATTIGGGSGGRYFSHAPGIGGSGGGGARSSGDAGRGNSKGAEGTFGQGYRGGDHPGSGTGPCGGGGGAGGRGRDKNDAEFPGEGSYGGPGLRWLDNKYYAGGGAGGPVAQGGIGGGGGYETSGAPNTGGGGGTGDTNDATSPGDGGSGVVIVRYPVDVDIPLFDPTQLDDLVAWYDMSDESTLTVSSTDVTAIADKSGHANDLSPSGAGYYQLSKMSGRTAIYNDSAGTEVGYQTGAISLTSEITVFAVFDHPHDAAATGQNEYFFDSRGGGRMSMAFFHGVASDPFGVAFQAGDLYTSAYRPGINTPSWGAFRVTGTGDDEFWTSYNSTRLAASVSVGEIDGFTVGNYRIPAAQYNWDGHIGEVIVYNRPLSDAEVQLVESYLNKKWKINQPSYLVGGEIEVANGYRYHKFKRSDTARLVNLNGPVDVDYLVVAGGGGASDGAVTTSSGAGGAGGYLSGTAAIDANQVVTVGAGGGTGDISTGGVNGSDSSLGSIATSVGGGAGGAPAGTLANVAGKTGGSGGGGGSDTSSPADGGGGTGTVGQGNDGGSGDGGVPRVSGGGGGAGAAGTDAFEFTYGDGGVGLQWLDDNYYAGGGGGGTNNVGSGTGGLGGGGNGGDYDGTPLVAQPGEANTGGGAGGSGRNGPGAVGGSGIVILRYLDHPSFNIMTRAEEWWVAKDMVNDVIPGRHSQHNLTNGGTSSLANLVKYQGMHALYFDQDGRTQYASVTTAGGWHSIDAGQDWTFLMVASIESASGTQIAAGTRNGSSSGFVIYHENGEVETIHDDDLGSPQPDGTGFLPGERVRSWAIGRTGTNGFSSVNGQRVITTGVNNAYTQTNQLVIGNSAAKSPSLSCTMHFVGAAWFPSALTDQEIAEAAKIIRQEAAVEKK